MASLLTSSNISGATGAMIKHFDTFSAGRTITVYRESQRTEVSATDAIFGYGDNQPGVEFNFLEVKQDFPAIIRYAKSNQENKLTDMDVRYPESEVVFKVRQDCHDHIKNQRVTKVGFDGLFWTFTGGPRVKKFLGELAFYYYEVKRLQ